MHTSTKEDIARRFRREDRFVPRRIISKDPNRLFSVILSWLLTIIKILLKFRPNNRETLHRFLVVVQFKVEFNLRYSNEMPKKVEGCRRRKNLYRPTDFWQKHDSVASASNDSRSNTRINTCMNAYTFYDTGAIVT